MQIRQQRMVVTKGNTSLFSTSIIDAHKQSQFIFPSSIDATSFFLQIKTKTRMFSFIDSQKIDGF